jgi:hypothetical protein
MGVVCLIALLAEIGSGLYNVFSLYPQNDLLFYLYALVMTASNGVIAW